MKKFKLLIIEDDEGVREGLIHMLSKPYEVDYAVNGLEGLTKAIRNPPDVILLDLKMPDMDGFQCCKALRADSEFDKAPILVLSAFNNTNDRIKLFELGADDYITKPFDPKELLVRIQRALDRTGGKAFPVKAKQNSGNLLKFGQLTIDPRTQEVFIDNVSVHLSSIEFKLLHILIQNTNQLVDRNTILEFVWEKQKVSPRLMDPHILSLRTKLNGHNLTISSVYGKGYILKNL